MALTASILWLAGLARLLGEAAYALGPSTGLTAAPMLIGVVLVAAEVVLLWRWTWFRSFMTQSMQDIREFNGLPRESDAARAGPPSQSLDLPVLLGGSILLAAVLPGAIGAAVALFGGVVLRTGVAVLASRDIAER